MTFDDVKPVAATVLSEDKFVIFGGEAGEVNSANGIAKLFFWFILPPASEANL